MSNDETPAMKGGIVYLKNGLVGEIVGIDGVHSYQRLEIMIDGVRCYVDRTDVKVAGVLDRVVNELNKND